MFDPQILQCHSHKLKPNIKVTAGFNYKSKSQATFSTTDSSNAVSHITLITNAKAVAARRQRVLSSTAIHILTKKPHT